MGIPSFPVALHFGRRPVSTRPCQQHQRRAGRKTYATHVGTAAVDAGYQCVDRRRAARIGRLGPCSFQLVVPPSGCPARHAWPRHRPRGEATLRAECRKAARPDSRFELDKKLPFSRRVRLACQWPAVEESALVVGPSCCGRSAGAKGPDRVRCRSIIRSNRALVREQCPRPDRRMAAKPSPSLQRFRLGDVAHACSPIRRFIV